MLIVAFAWGCATEPEPMECSAFTDWGKENVNVTSGEAVAETDEVPGHCKVSGTIDEQIGFELLLPDEWNSKFVMSGGGGFVGTTANTLQLRPLPGVPTPLDRGYATASTDTGHRGEVADASWALDAPEREENFAHRAVHRTAETAKAVIQDYCGKPLTYSYFSGCSRGGGQALISAQRYPDDFDGLISGAPALDWPELGATFVYIQQHVFPDLQNADAPVITEDNRALLARELLSACDAVDGVEDGLLEDPRECGFDPADLPRCAADQPKSDCLTAEQLRAVQAVYEGLSVNGRRLSPGFPFGGENDPLGWSGWITGIIFPVPGPSLQHAFGTHIYKYLVFDDPDWDYASYDFANWEEDTKAAAKLLNATDSNLSAFRDTGAKLVLWHGWSDSALPALDTIDDYEEVEAQDAHVRDYARLFMLPGVSHCDGGPGPDSVDWIDALEAWVERGKAPERIVATKRNEDGQIVMTRPLCPYPLVARWDGSGDPDNAASFACVELD